MGFWGGEGRLYRARADMLCRYIYLCVAAARFEPSLDPDCPVIIRSADTSATTRPLRSTSRPLITPALRIMLMSPLAHPTSTHASIHYISNPPPPSTPIPFHSHATPILFHSHSTPIPPTFLPHSTPPPPPPLLMLTLHPPPALLSQNPPSLHPQFHLHAHSASASIGTSTSNPHLPLHLQIHSTSGPVVVVETVSRNFSSLFYNNRKMTTTTLRKNTHNGTRLLLGRFRTAAAAAESREPSRAEEASFASIQLIPRLPREGERDQKTGTADTRQIQSNNMSGHLKPLMTAHARASVSNCGAGGFWAGIVWDHARWSSWPVRPGSACESTCYRLLVKSVSALHNPRQHY